MPALRSPSNRDDRVAIVQPHVPLSQSVLWQFMEDYYRQGSLNTWSCGEASTPCYITCNTVIADAYAELVCSFLDDHFDRLDLEQPVYLLELAAGSGMFSHHLLGALRRRLAASQRLKTVKLRFVMTDFNEKVVEAWEKVESFAAHADVLDSAVFRPETDRSLRLRKHDRTLSAASFCNPTVVVANYFFDTIRSDAFQAVDGALYEALYQTSEDRTGALDPRRPFRRFSTQVVYRKVGLPYYEEPQRDALLKDYVERYRDCGFLLPRGALNVIDTLHATLRSGFLLVSSDKGFTSLDAVRGVPKFDYAEHGSISFAVNYDAIDRYVGALGGSCLATKRNSTSLSTIAAALLPEPGGRGSLGSELRRVFCDRLLDRDELNVAAQIQAPFRIPIEDPKSVEEALEIFHAASSLLRSLRYDPFALVNAAHLFHASVPRLAEAHRADLYADLKKIEPNVYLGLASSDSALLTLALLYMLVGQARDALRVATEAQKVFGDSKRCTAVLADCHRALGNDGPAVECMDRLRSGLGGERLSEADVAQYAALSARIAHLRARSLEPTPSL
jgi:hypothetical protein